MVLGRRLEIAGFLSVSGMVGNGLERCFEIDCVGERIGGGKVDFQVKFYTGFA